MNIYPNSNTYPYFLSTSIIYLVKLHYEKDVIGRGTFTPCVLISNFFLFSNTYTIIFLLKSFFYYFYKGKKLQSGMKKAYMLIIQISILNFFISNNKISKNSSPNSNSSNIYKFNYKLLLVCI